MSFWQQRARHISMQLLEQQYPQLKDKPITEPTEALLDEREKTHGSFALNAKHGQTLRTFFRTTPGWQVANDREREALDYIAGKLSRILSGKPDPQHWEDIAGYATLVTSDKQC